MYANKEYTLNTAIMVPQKNSQFGQERISENNHIILIKIAEMAVFNMAGYLIRHIQMRKPYQLPGWTKNSSYSAPVEDQTHDLPPP